MSSEGGEREIIFFLNGASNRILVILTALSDPFMWMLCRSYFPYLEFACTETHRFLLPYTLPIPSSVYVDVCMGQPLMCL